MSPVLEATDLVKEFTVKALDGLRVVHNKVQAVSGVNFSIEPGEMVASQLASTGSAGEARRPQASAGTSPLAVLRTCRVG